MCSESWPCLGPGSCPSQRCLAVTILLLAKTAQGIKSYRVLQQPQHIKRRRHFPVVKKTDQEIPISRGMRRSTKDGALGYVRLGLPNTCDVPVQMTGEDCS